MLIFLVTRLEPNQDYLRGKAYDNAQKQLAKYAQKEGIETIVDFCSQHKPGRFGLKSTDQIKFIPPGWAQELPSIGSTLYSLYCQQLEDGIQLQLKPTSIESEPAINIKGRMANIYSILPPLAAIVVALVFHKLLWALLFAIWLGAVISHGINPLHFLPAMAVDYIWESVADEFKIHIFIFTTSLIGMVNVISRCGGTRGLVDLVTRFASTRRSTRVATVLMGFLVFFDDYANTIIVGTTVRPLTDKMSISREKLAYLVDSTAAPVAGLAIISTWIGYEVSLFADVSAQLGLNQSGYSLFFSALPFRFYCIFTLFFILYMQIIRRDYGPMYRAEKRAQQGQLMAPGAVPLTSATFTNISIKDGAPCRWYNAIIPVAVTLVGTVLGMLYSGEGFTRLVETPMAFFTLDLWQQSFSEADNAKVMAYCALLGSALAIGLAVGQKILTVGESLKAWAAGVRAMSLAVAILTLAWSMGSVCSQLQTAHFLVALLQDNVPLVVLPLAIFILAGLVAFSTGTSWGTMAILIPTAIPLVYAISGVENQAVIFLSLAAVLDGAIFGDHCSPISDTTIMSSIATACDHLDHVRTQIPYAMTCMIAAALCGYLCFALTSQGVLSYVLGFTLLAGTGLILGKKV